MSAHIRIESGGRLPGTKVVHVAEDGTETDLSRITTRVAWECRATHPATAEITTLPASIVARIAPDLVSFLPRDEVAPSDAPSDAWKGRTVKVKIQVDDSELRAAIERAKDALRGDLA